MRRSNAFPLLLVFGLISSARGSLAADGKTFVLPASTPECEDPLKSFALPNFLLKGAEYKASLLPLRLATAELLFNHSPDERAGDSVIGDEKTRLALEAILHDRISTEMKANFSQWEHLFQSLLMQSNLLYRHQRLGLDKQSLISVLEKEVPHTVNSLMVPSAAAEAEHLTETNSRPRQSRIARFLGLADNTTEVIKRPAALANYRYISAPNLYKVLLRFDERLRLDLLRTLIQDPATEFPNISHIEAYVLLAALPRNSQTAAWDLLLPKVITRAEMFPAQYLADATRLVEPEAFLKSLAANQGQLEIEELLSLLQQTRGKTPIRIEEIAKGNSFPTVSHEKALELLKKYGPLDFESAYAIAWSYSVQGRSVEAIGAFVEDLEKSASPALTFDQSHKIRSKIAERVWPLVQGSPGGTASLRSKIEVSKFLKVGRTFILSRLYWELQTLSSVNAEELEAIIDAIPMDPHRSTYDGTKTLNGKPAAHEVIYADSLFSDLALELRFSGSPAIKWYFSDLYWMGITTNLVVMNMILQIAPQKQIAPALVDKIKTKITALFANVHPLTPEAVDPQHKWKIAWEPNNNVNIYTYNPSQPDELAPGRRGVTVERVREYFNRIADKLVQR